MSELVEKVARAINYTEWGADLSMSEAELAEKSEMARAAIAAVAEWIGPEYCVTRGNLLKQLDLPPPPEAK